ncbi:TPA: phosphoglycerate dehydrogenase [Aeromonas dhakensis]|nr:phosphoglycerate dehydrogenase [Aeromonas dhakensis]
MRIAITSKAFSKNKELITLLSEYFSDFKLNYASTKLTDKELINFICDCDGVILALESINENVISHCPKLKVISKFGVGTDNIDFDVCEKYSIPVLHTPGVNSESVAELALTFSLMLLRNVFISASKLSSGIWDKNGGQSLYGKTIGIVGCGHVGLAFINLLKPFGCDVLIYDIIDKSEICKLYNVKQVSLDELLQTSDIVSLHVPLTDLTTRMVDIQFLYKMKRTAFIINTSRGDNLVIDDLYQAMVDGVIAGAAIDVYPIEPPQCARLLALPNLIPTPHIGGNSREATYAMGKSAIEKIYQFLYPL